MNTEIASVRDSFEKALVAYNEEENKENYRVLLEEVLRRGYAVDLELKNGQTLLHHAVSLNMEREAVQLLRSGAQITKNKYNKTPIDIALERGNQIMIQLLKRSADYHKYIQNKYSDTDFDCSATTSVDRGEAFGASKYAWTPLLDRNTDVTLWGSCYRLGDVYEDYLDWTDSQKCAYLQRLLESLRISETKFQATLDTYSERKDTALARLKGMDCELRDREHRYCMKIWGTVEGERSSRAELESISLHTQKLKDTLDKACRRVFWEGQGQMRYYNGFVIKMWKRVHIRLSGASLYLSYTELSSRKSRSRVIAMDHIDKIEVSTRLVMFPLLRGSRDGHDAGEETLALAKGGGQSSGEASGDASLDIRGDKLYFTFYFKSSENDSTPGTMWSQSPATSTTSPSSFGTPLSRSSPCSYSPLAALPVRAPPPKHPIVVSVEDTNPSSQSADVDTNAFLFLAALREAVMPHVTITTAAAVLAREMKGKCPVEVSYPHEHGQEDSMRVRTAAGVAYSAPVSEWGDYSSSGLTSVESILMSSRSSSSTNTFSFSSTSMARSSSGSNRSWVGCGVPVDIDSPTGPLATGSNTPEGPLQSLSSSLPKTFFSALTQASPTSAGTCSGGRGRKTGTVLGRVVEERDGGERSTSNDSSAHGSSVHGMTVAGGFGSHCVADDAFIDCSTTLNTQNHRLGSKVTPQSWGERDSFGSLTMGSSNASVLARSVEEAAQYAQTCLLPPHTSTRVSHLESPVSSLTQSLLREEISLRCFSSAGQVETDHGNPAHSRGLHALPVDARTQDDNHADWKSVCSEGRGSLEAASPRRHDSEPKEATENITGVDDGVQVEEVIRHGGYEFSDDVNVDVMLGGACDDAEQSDVKALEDVKSCPLIRQLFEIPTSRPSLLSLSLQQQSTTPVDDSEGTMTDITSTKASPAPTSHEGGTSSSATSATMTFSYPSTSFVSSSTAGYGVEFDIAFRPALSSPTARRRSLPLSPSSGSPWSPSAAQAKPRSPNSAHSAEPDGTVSSPPIKIPPARDTTDLRHEDGVAVALFGRELPVLDPGDRYGGKGLAVMTPYPPGKDELAIGPAPPHLYGTPTTSISYDPMSLRLSMSLEGGDRDEDGLGNVLLPPGKTHLLHTQSESTVTQRAAVCTFMRRELTAAAASYASASSLGRDDDEDEDGDAISSCLDAGSVEDRLSAASLPIMNLSASLEKDDLVRRGTVSRDTGVKRAKSDYRQRLLGKHYERVRRSEGHSSPASATSGILAGDKSKSVHAIAKNLSRIRRKRDFIQQRLVQYITDRENHLQILHFLQSIRRVVARPPVAPADTHIYAASPIPQIERQNRKAFSMLTLLRNSRHKSEGPSAAGDGLEGSVEPGDEACNMIETAAERDPVKTEADSQHMLGQGGNRVRCGSDSSTNSNGSYSTDQYRSSLPTCREEYISEAEEFVYSMLAPAESLDTASDCARDITGARSSAAGLCTPTKDLRREGDWDSVERKGQEPFGLSISQQVGPPPEALLHVYERARKCLEEIWHCDMVIFETVEKLAQCLLLKEQTWQRLRRVRAEESVIVTPDLEDLYDIDL